MGIEVRGDCDWKSDKGDAGEDLKKDVRSALRDREAEDEAESAFRAACRIASLERRLAFMKIWGIFDNLSDVHFRGFGGK